MCVESHIGFVTRKRVAGFIPVFSAPKSWNQQVAVVNSQLFITIVFLTLRQHGAGIGAASARRCRHRRGDVRAGAAANHPATCRPAGPKRWRGQARRGAARRGAATPGRRHEAITRAGAARHAQKCNNIVQYSKTFYKTLYNVEETLSLNCTIWQKYQIKIYQ